MMCQIGTCTNSADVLIESEESEFSDYVAVCRDHIPANAETFPIGQVF